MDHSFGKSGQLTDLIQLGDAVLPEHLDAMIVLDVAIAAGESVDKVSDVAVSLEPLHRQCCQLQPGNPALCAGSQCGHVLRRQVKAHHFVQKGRDLVACEAQVIGTYLGHLATSPQA